MSQGIFSTINPSTTSGTQLAQLLNDWKDAVVTSNSGTSRPTNLQAWGYWADVTNAPIIEIKFYDGVSDITALTIDSTTGTVSISTAANLIEVLKKSDDDLGPIFNLIKSRVAGGGQVLVGDNIGEIDFTGTRDDSVETTQARIFAESLNNVTATQKGSMIVFEAVSTNTNALVEIMRLIDGKVGIGIDAPVEALEVDGDVKAYRVSDDAEQASIILKKSRIAGNGGVVNDDFIASVKADSTSSTGADIPAVAEMLIQATENHTDTQRGAEFRFRTTTTGGTTKTDKMIIGDTVEIPGTLNADTINVTNLTATQTELGTITETEDPSIVLNKGGTQAGADAAVGGFEVEMSDATNFKMGYDSTLASKVKAGEVGALKELVNVDSAQGLSNKAIINPSRIDLKKDTFANLETYALTATDGQLVFATDRKEVYKVVDTGLELVGGAGGGGILPTTNYLADAEDETLWVRYANGVAGNKPDDFSGVPSATTVWDVELNELTPIRGDRNIRLNKKTGSNVQGEGIYFPFSLATADITSILRLAGDAVTSANYGDGYLRLYVVASNDLFVADFNVIEITPTELLAGEGSIRGEFQTLYAGYEYRFCIHFADAVEVDIYTVDIKAGLGKSEVASGQITKQESVSIIGYTSKDGSGNVLFKTEDTDRSNYGEVISVNNSTQTRYTALKKCQVEAVFSHRGTAATHGSYINHFNSSDVLIKQFAVYDTDTERDKSIPAVTVLNVGDYLLANTNGTPIDTIGTSFSINATHISDNVVLSSEDDGRFVAVAYCNNSGESIAGGNDIIFSTEGDGNNTGAWDGSGYTAVKTEWVDIEGSCRTSASLDYGIDAKVDGVTRVRISDSDYSTNIKKFSGKVYLKKGERLSVSTPTAITLSASSTQHCISITSANSGSQQIAASARDEVEATDTASDEYTTSYRSLKFNNVTRNTFGSFDGSTGLYTAKRAGFAKFDITLLTQSESWTANTSTIIRAIGPSLTKYNINRLRAAGTFSVGHSAHFGFYLNKDETVQLEFYSGVTTNLEPVDGYNFISITMD